MFYPIYVDVRVSTYFRGFQDICDEILYISCRDLPLIIWATGWKNIVYFEVFGFYAINFGLLALLLQYKVI